VLALPPHGARWCDLNFKVGEFRVFPIDGVGESARVWVHGVCADFCRTGSSDIEVSIADRSLPRLAAGRCRFVYQVTRYPFKGLGNGDLLPEAPPGRALVENWRQRAGARVSLEPAQPKAADRVEYGKTYASSRFQPFVVKARIE
jgi:hypothetical protein